LLKQLTTNNYPQTPPACTGVRIERGVEAVVEFRYKSGLLLDFRAPVQRLHGCGA
jgi:hypothetical protein